VQRQLAAYTTGTVTRLAGADRYAAAAAVSANTVTAPVTTVYLATGATFPDALAGAPLAGASGSPVLLVRRDTIPASVHAELTRLKPEKIVVLGGPGSVSDAVRAWLGTYLQP
jgi:putative cell wall-binding protein